VRSVTAVADAAQALYREASSFCVPRSAARCWTPCCRTRNRLAQALREALASRAAEMGLSVRSVGLAGHHPAGRHEDLLNQVIAAQKEAEANLIRRREETASVRSQANTAKLLADNPQLARAQGAGSLLRLLAGAKTTFVFAPGDLAGQVKALVTQDA